MLGKLLNLVTKKCVVSMKRYSYNIARWNSDEIFSPIRSKKDSIRLLMKTLKLMITNQEVPEHQIIGQLVLVISKMSRLFYFSKSKYFSINFPFFVTETDSGLIYYSNHISDIDSRVTSTVLSILSAVDQFDASCVLEFADPIATISESNQEFWPFFRELLLHEDGYVRCDYDEEHENAQLHPLNHLDIFYSSETTFKIGLRKKIEEELLIDVLSIESNCSYLE